MRKAAMGLLALILALAVATLAAPRANAHITNNVQHLLEHVLQGLGAIQAKTDALPADPAARSDVTAARDQVMAAVGDRGFFPGQRISQCPNRTTVVPAPGIGNARLVTVSVQGLSPAGTYVEVIHPRDDPFFTPVTPSYGRPETFVDSVTDADRIDVCWDVGGAIVSANWIEVPSS